MGTAQSSTIEVSSLEEYLGYVNTNHASDKRFVSIFRGQSEDFPLLPKLARLYNDARIKGDYFHTERAMLDEFERAGCDLYEFFDDSVGAYVTSPTPWHGDPTIRLDRKSAVGYVVLGC